MDKYPLKEKVIRKLRIKGFTYQSIADKFDYSRTYVRKVILEGFKKKPLDKRLVYWDVPRWFTVPVTAGMWNDLVMEVVRLKLKDKNL